MKSEKAVDICGLECKLADFFLARDEAVSCQIKDCKRRGTDDCPIHRYVYLNELKPCPFCGGEAKFIERFYGAYKDVTIACKQCGIRSTLFSTELEAVTFWNRRAESKSGSSVE